MYGGCGRRWRQVIDRIRFATLLEVAVQVDEAALPTYAGGQGGGVETDAHMLEWIRRRLAGFPAIPAELHA